MSELRKDPITREWVCIATEGAKRPSDFSQNADHTNGRHGDSTAGSGSAPQRTAGNLLATTRTDHGALPL